MQKELMIAVFAGLGGMFGWGLADFFAKKTIDKIGDFTTLFWCQLVGIFPLLLLFLLHPVFPQFSQFQWVYLILLGAWSGLSYIPTYTAFGKGKVSLLSPIFASNAVLVVIISALFFGEVIPFARGISFVIVFIGVLLINGDPLDIWLLIRGKKTEAELNVKGLPEILLAVFLYAIWLIALDRFISGLDWVPVLLVIRIFSTVALFLYARVTARKLSFTNTSLWKYIILVGVFDVAAFGFVSYGFSATSFVSIVAMLSGAFSLPTIFLGRIFLKEQTTKLQFFGSLTIIAGVMLLAAVS